ncbi:MAG: M23 family metallopeptidase [Saccharospirillaceae bacterium]|nr:M23 family metallopeptidase [Pseudomonadales bacterium]NRB79948.1 M23 family metallopeptidase [Saccharospirillaceae bacterium]
MPIIKVSIIYMNTLLVMKWIRINQIIALLLSCTCLTLEAKLTSIIKKAALSGGYVLLKSSPDAIVEFANRQYQVDSKGYLAIGFNRELSGKYEISITSASGLVEIKEIQITAQQYNIQRVEALPSSRVITPKKVAIINRIQAESAKVKQARASSGDFDYWRVDEFMWPAKGRISGVYGSQRYYNGIAASPHWGVDIAAPEGSPVYAPAGGKIVLAENDLYYSGGTIILDHGADVSSSFLHLSDINVTVGDIVKKGELIGLVGSTGRSNGPHLDWRMNIHGVRIDAKLWVKELEL